MQEEGSMSNLRILAAVFVGALTLLVSGAQQTGADPLLGVIDIRPILARHPDIGNSLGVAYNPTSDVIYLAHGSGGPAPGSFIYTLDIQGMLLNELNFQLAYRPESFPTSLSYDSNSGRLFVFALGVGEGIGNIVEMSPDGSTIFSEFTVPLGGGGGIVARDDGIWQSLFTSDIIRHYTRDGGFIEDVSLADSFPPGFPGPSDLTSSFMDGFFIADFFGRRIVEVDIAGTEVTAVSTSSLGDGRGLAIDADVKNQRIFLQVNNEEIYVLSAEFIGVTPKVISIDIKPGSSPNRLNPKSHGVIPVAILTTDTLDATTVDPLSVRFGPKGAKEVHKTGHIEDVNHDGEPDLVLHFKTQATGMKCGDISASLTGETFDGDPIQGSDSIKTVGCKK
jgi:hypothetical protein